MAVYDKEKEADLKPKDKDQGFYDDAFNKQVDNDFSLDDEAGMEERAGLENGFFRNINGGVASKENGVLRAGRRAGGLVSGFKKYKKTAIGGGIVASIVGTLMAGFFNILTFKTSFIHQIVDQRFGNRVSSIMETRFNRLVSSYIIQTSRGLGPDNLCERRVSSDCRMNYQGLVAPMFKSMFDTRFEEKLAARGIVVEYDKNNRTGVVRYPGGIADIAPDGSPNEIIERRGGKFSFAQILDDAIKDTSEKDFRLKNLWLRLSGRSYAERRGVKKFCWVGCKTRDEIDSKKVSAANRLKIAIVTRAPFSTSVKVTLACLIDDCTDAEFRSKRTTALLTRFEDEVGEAAVQEILDSTKPRAAKNFLMEKMLVSLMGDTAGKAVAASSSKAIPVIGWIFLFDAVHSIDQKIDDNSFSRWVAQMHLQQYMDFYVLQRTLSDEGVAGVQTAEEVGAVAAQFDDFEDSRLYQGSFTASPADLREVQLSEGESSYCADPVLPAAGEPCEDMKIFKQAAFERWRDNSVVSGALDSVFFAYEQGGPVSPENIVGAIRGSFDSLLGSVTTAALSLIPGFTNLVAGVQQEVFEVAVQYLLKPPIDAEDVGARFFDATVAGADVFSNSVIRDVLGGQTVERSVVQSEVGALLDEDKEEFKSKPLFDRIADTSNPYSLVNRVAVSTDAWGVKEDIYSGTRTLASVLNPIKAIGSIFGSTGVVHAQSSESQENIPNGAFGNAQYSISDEVLQSDPEALTDERCGELNELREESVEYDEDTGEPIYDMSNPCMLDEAILESIGCYFNNDLCPDVSGTLSAITPGAQGPQNLEYPPNLDRTPNSEGYLTMPESPEGIYEFSQGAPDRSRCGSEALTGVIYTVAKRWRQKYPNSKIIVGDLNEEIGHKSHMNGIDVDITVEGTPDAANTASDPTSKYSTELGLMFADTGIIQVIFYNDVRAQTAFNQYVAQYNLAGRMGPYPGHANHFHVRIDSKYEGVPSGKCAS